MAAYPTDRVWNASALLVQLAEQLEGLPRHARRLAPLISEPDGRLCRVAVSDPDGFRKRANMSQKGLQKLRGQCAIIPRKIFYRYPQTWSEA